MPNSRLLLETRLISGPPPNLVMMMTMTTNEGLGSQSRAQ